MNYPFRKTTQALLPIQAPKSDGYTVFPTIETDSPIHIGFNRLANELATSSVIIIDGYGGVDWDNFKARLSTCLTANGGTQIWFPIAKCLKNEAEIQACIAQSMGSADSIFGKRYTGNLLDFFDPQRLANIPKTVDAKHYVIYGTGASLCGLKGTVLYLDIPKNEIQYRMRANAMQPIGTFLAKDNAQNYKRLYFVDWPVLNKHKQQLLDKMDVVVDEQRHDQISWMRGGDFRQALDEALAQPFRARPWFEAGVWGGQWMKKHLQGLYPNEINYAWSFELITPENGIIFGNNGNLMEVSFDFLAFRNAEKLLGKATSRFKTEFPIRFDFLDTFDGDNLSIQCHPSPQYTKTHFGEDFTQDETYYIMDCDNTANVYLGFREGINPDEFKQALTDNLLTSQPLDIERFVQKHKANKHDLFLIPNQTIHASGTNNLVLEISSTPYIFTFKMYDWKRLDLSGKPRPINLEHAFNNLDFTRQGNVVTQTLMAKPQLMQTFNGGKKYKLPTHPEHFYTVDRYEFDGEVTIETLGQCHIGMLVEGQHIEIVGEDKRHRFYFAETFVIPANLAQYTIKNTGSAKAYVVVAYVKDECC